MNYTVSSIFESHFYYASFFVRTSNAASSICQEGATCSLSWMMLAHTIEIGGVSDGREDAILMSFFEKISTRRKLISSLYWCFQLMLPQRSGDVSVIGTDKPSLQPCAKRQKQVCMFVPCSGSCSSFLTCSSRYPLCMESLTTFPLPIWPVQPCLIFHMNSRLMSFLFPTLLVLPCFWIFRMNSCNSFSATLLILT